MKKIIRKSIALLATAVMGMALFTGCGAANSPSSSGETAEKKESAEDEGNFDGTVSIAGIAPLTGSFASWGEGAENGYNLAIKEVNAAGGVKIGDKSYKLESAVFADDKSDATEAASAYNNCSS